MPAGAPVAPAGGVSTAAQTPAPADAAQTPARSPVPPAPTAPRRAAPAAMAGATAAVATGAPPRTPAARQGRGRPSTSPAEEARDRMPADATRGVSRRRSPARATVLVVGAVILAAVAVVVALTAFKGGSSPSAANSASVSARVTHHARTAPSHQGSPSPASPAETHVVVLNGTTDNGLAHRLSASLQQSGFARAAPLDGTPPGSFQTTVVEYTSGHHAEAAAVAQALGVSELQPLEASVGSLAPGSPVVVIAGQDKASEGTGETASGGEASAGAEASSGNGATP